MLTSFLTLKEGKEVRININNSIFLGNGREVNSISEAKEYIKSIKNKYPDANHHASGFILENEVGADDDGEPSGSSGVPILNAIKRSDLYNVIIVVTRYFGGKKLGVRGLINAYGKAATLLIDESELIRRKKGYLYEIKTSYQNADYIGKKSFFSDLEIIESKYSDQVYLKLFIKDELVEEFEEKLNIIKHEIISKDEYIC